MKNSEMMRTLNAPNTNFQPKGEAINKKTTALTTEQYKEIITAMRKEGIKCVSGGDTRHGLFFPFFEVGLPYFILPDSRHLLGFLTSLCGGEVCGRIPSRTLEELLAA